MQDKTAIDVKLEFIIQEIGEIKAKLENKYVTQEEFKPVKSLVYGLVSIILTAVVVALLAFTMK